MFGPFLKLFDVIPGFVWALFLLGAIGVGVVEREVALNRKVTIATMTATAKTLETAQEKSALEATNLRAEVGTLRSTKALEIANATYAEKQKTAAALADGTGTRKRLLDTTDSLASRGREGIRDSEALGRVEARAEAFGKLLGRCDAVAEGLGSGAEDLATQVRGLQGQYGSLFLRPASDPVAHSH